MLRVLRSLSPPFASDDASPCPDWVLVFVRRGESERVERRLRGRGDGRAGDQACALVAVVVVICGGDIYGLVASTVGERG